MEGMASLDLNLGLLTPDSAVGSVRDCPKPV